MFVTGPKTRAPLGLKTTNAKTKAFQTPAPPLGTIKANRPSTGRKSKLIIAQSESVESDVLSVEAEEDVPDIEYMPPNPIPLPDPPEDIEYDDTYPQFKGDNLYRGWTELHREEVGEDGLTDSQRSEEEKGKNLDKRFEDMCFEEMAKGEDADLGTLHDRFRKMMASDKQPRSANPSTIKARGAAAALSRPKTSNLSKPTAASAAKAKTPTSLAVPKNKPLQASIHGAARHAAAVTSSNTSMGYAKGRNVSRALQPSTFKQQQAPTQYPQKDNIHLDGDVYRDTFLVDILASSASKDVDQEPLFEDDGDDDFQLPMPA